MLKLALPNLRGSFLSPARLRMESFSTSTFLDRRNLGNNTMEGKFHGKRGGVMLVTVLKGSVARWLHATDFAY